MIPAILRMTFDLKLLNRLFNESDKLRIQISLCCLGTLWSPIVHLRTAVRKLGNGNITNPSLVQRFSKA